MVVGGGPRKGTLIWEAEPLSFFLVCFVRAAARS